MTKLTELLAQIKTTLSQNNSGLTDNRLTDLNQSCDNITNSLSQIEQVLDQLQKFSMGIEVAPEDLANSLRELNLREITGQSLKNKLVEILQLASDNNQALTNKIKETEQELETILTQLQQQQVIITNYQTQITQLETKIKANQNQAHNLQIKAGLVGAGIMASFGGLVVLMARYLQRLSN